MFAMRFLAEAGHEPTIGWLLWLLLALFFVVSFVGYWVSRNRPAAEATEQHEAPAHHAEPEAAPDDLRKIEGIGPKVQELLNKMGIKTFAQLAEADPQAVQKMLDEAGLQMMNPEGWIMQARLAAKGDWEGFAKLLDELKGGRVMR